MFLAFPFIFLFGTPIFNSLIDQGICQCDEARLDATARFSGGLEDGEPCSLSEFQNIILSDLSLRDLLLATETLLITCRFCRA